MGGRSRRVHRQLFIGDRSGKKKQAAFYGGYTSVGLYGQPSGRARALLTLGLGTFGGSPALARHLPELIQPLCAFLNRYAHSAGPIVDT